MMSHQKASAFAREWTAAWNSRDIDRVVSYYADDVEVESPFIPAMTGEASGVLRGKAAARAYWGRAIDRFGDLHFQVLDVCVGMRSVCVRFRSLHDATAMAVFWFNAEGKVSRAAAHYVLPEEGVATEESAAACMKAAEAHRSAMYAVNVTPILNVSDMTASFAWFDRLGWRKCWEWKENPAGPASFGAVGSGQCEIFLCHNGQGGRGKSELAMTSGPGGEDGADKGVWMSVWVDNVDEMHTRCVQRGVEVTWPPTNEPWGVREMHVRHPDGHVLRISQAIHHE